MTQATKPLVVQDATKGVRVNASVVAQPFRDEVKRKVEDMKRMGLGTFVCRIIVCCISTPSRIKQNISYTCHEF